MPSPLPPTVDRGAACPKCGSQSTQRLALIFESGLHGIDAATVGIGAIGPGVGFGVANTRGTQQSALSKRVSPPKKQPVGRWVVLFLILATIALFTNSVGWWIAALLLGGGPILTATLYNSKQWPSLYETWSRTFMCLRCGNSFLSSHVSLPSGVAVLQATPVGQIGERKPVALGPATARGFCTNCGQQIDPTTENFCGSCGSPVRGEQPVAGESASISLAKIDYGVNLLSAGPKKINVIAVLRQIIPELGLSEAKHLVEHAPAPVKSRLGWEEANSIKAKLEAQGASVEIT